MESLIFHTLPELFSGDGASQLSQTGGLVIKCEVLVELVSYTTGVDK